MRIETARAVAAAGDAAGFEFEVREAYSGRGMFGQTTAALEYDSLGELLGAVAVAGARAAEAANNGPDPRNADPFTLDDLAEDLHRVRVDKMGRGWVIY